MIYSIVILYNPKETSTIDDYVEIVDESDMTFFVDNSSSNNYDILSSYDDNKISYLPLRSNLGIATAQNFALKKILNSSENDLDKVFFFDQDSKVSTNFILRMSESFNALLSKKIPVGLLGPLPVNKATGVDYPIKSACYGQGCVGLDTRYTQLDCLISSGSVTNVGVVKKCGLMKDELFIDSVDHEWSWRILNFGFINLMDLNIKMSHLFGEGDINFFGLAIRKGSPIRYYYSFRNWFYLFRLNYVPFEFKLKTLLKMPVKFFIYLVVFDDKFSRFKFMLKGIYHGIINKFGMYK
ncbi:glycosyltransferase [Parashewanella spongiae]|uniref:Glycosyltransferase n=1 Tax=Parashewanella spongiae TaxID=342950 RepID=A0A3A6TZ29_9GAMM|nr:glycosyltransferase [Parashewanella spongiae]MCL1077686.1 glycosyltransferase [Parashewanella spongiae]RJY18229.1 glycosyltransferase [Parashewanella spongiae]